MKRVFNGLNKAGLLAILFAAVVITTQSAFTSRNFASTWGFDATEGWVDINNLPSTGNPDTHYEYNCDDLVPTTCTYIYPAGSPSNPDPLNPPVADRDGEFYLTEVPN